MIAQSLLNEFNQRTIRINTTDYPELLQEKEFIQWKLREVEIQSSSPELRFLQQHWECMWSGCGRRTQLEPEFSISFHLWFKESVYPFPTSYSLVLLYDDKAVQVTWNFWAASEYEGGRLGEVIRLSFPRQRVYLHSLHMLTREAYKDHTALCGKFPRNSIPHQLSF